jgi:uncharacterized protein (DUF1684 family)
MEETLDAVARVFELMLDEQLKITAEDLQYLTADTPWKVWLQYTAAQIAYAYDIDMQSPATVAFARACVLVTLRRGLRGEFAAPVAELEAQALEIVRDNNDLCGTDNCATLLQNARRS